MSAQGGGKLAMVPEGQAIVGRVFRAVVDPRCFVCRLYSVCSKSLRSGWRYRVVSVRRAAHVCPIIGERMYVVEVVEEPLLGVVESRVAVAGVRLRYRRMRCESSGCRFYRLCAQPPLLDGEVVRVVRVLHAIDCLRGRRLSLAELLPEE